MWAPDSEPKAGSWTVKTTPMAIGGFLAPGIILMPAVGGRKPNFDKPNIGEIETTQPEEFRFNQSCSSIYSIIMVHRRSLTVTVTKNTRTRNVTFIRHNNTTATNLTGSGACEVYGCKRTCCSPSASWAWSMTSAIALWYALNVFNPRV